MNVVLVGLSHKTAPVEIRERVAFSGVQLSDALSKLLNDHGLSEAVIISTCNRVELLAEAQTASNLESLLKTFLCEYHSVDLSQLEKHLYSLSGPMTIQHVFRVASSVDSMVVGESQILGQLKQAFVSAQQAGAVGNSFKQLFSHAFFVAKRVRTETRIANASVSISSVAVDLAEKIFGSLKGRGVLLLGAGEMSELATRSLVCSGVSRVTVANRTNRKAEELASKFHGKAVGFEHISEQLAKCDIAIVSTRADSFVLDRALMDRVIRERKYSPLFIIDISVPRNVDPKVNSIENIFLFDIDDLDSVVSANLQERAQEAQLAEAIIQQEFSNFVAGRRRRDLGPVVASLRQRIENICLEELKKNQNGFSPEEITRIRKMMLKTAHRIAHPLMQQIKDAHQSPRRQQYNVEMIKEAFKLDDPK